MQHSLDLQLEYVRTALGQDKRPIGFLIGAGAPMSLKKGGKALIPDLVGLTQQIKEQADAGDLATIEALLGDLAKGATLEDLLGYIRSLTAIPGDKDVRGFSLEKLRSLDAQICGIVRKLVSVSLPETENAYHALALWLRSVTRDMPVQLFTTNYDLLMEQALERQHVAYFDGFIGSYKPLFDLEAVEEDSLPRRWVRLWKLHGSANWQRGADDMIWRGSPNSEDKEAVLIYPSHLKYDQSRRLPYLAMIDRLRGFLRQPGTILISVGFSYRDQHINEVLTQALRANQTASIQALMFGEMSKHEECIDLAKSSPNLTALAYDGAIVGGRQGAWAPTKNTETGDETPNTFEYGDFEKLGNLLTEIIGKPGVIKEEGKSDS